MRKLILKIHQNYIIILLESPLHIIQIILIIFIIKKKLKIIKNFIYLSMLSVASFSLAKLIFVGETNAENT